MPFKVILAKRTTLQQALDKWSDEVGPIKVSSMTQDMDDDESVTLVVFYQTTDGFAGSGYGPQSEAPRQRNDAGKKDEDFGEAPECPQCGSEMVIRRRKADNVPFWGCKEFPSCRGIVNIDDDDAPKKNGKKNGKKKSDEPLPGQSSLGFGGSGEDEEEDDIPF